MRAEIAICEGGACSRNGAALLLGACAALGGADLRVVGAACTSKCQPWRGFSNSGGQSVASIVRGVRSNRRKPPSPARATRRLLDGEDGGDAALPPATKRAVPLFFEALELAPPKLLQPCHDELMLPADFEDSLWETNLGELQLAESITSSSLGRATSYAHRLRSR